ncbi:MAG: hypothetical protein MUF35_04695 [Candidatus Nanopelagicales bacterium]|jgi:hypothetical protein|nr:hypothetical protein [Candidatus Nanopelagicales bacterium]
MAIDLSPWSVLLGGDDTTDPITWAYLPSMHDGDAGAALRWRAVRQVAAEQGASTTDLAALDDRVLADEGDWSPHYVAVRGGRVIWNQRFDDDVVVGATAGHGPIADIWPLVEHARARVPYLLVEAGRGGGEVSLHRAGRTVQRSTEGSDPHLKKVRGGGWSHRRIQAHTEEVWRRNAAELEQEVEALWRDEPAELVVLAGDVRAREKFRGSIPVALDDVLVEVDRHTRPEGADSGAVDSALDLALDDRQRREEEVQLDDLGRHLQRGTACLGETAVAEALAVGQAGTLMLDARAHLHGRAALLGQAARTSAELVVVEHRGLPEGASVAALLRWPTPTDPDQSAPADAPATR